MKKILVIGMYEKAMYHPLTGVDRYLTSIQPDVQFTFSEQICDLCKAEEYDAVISYWDDWDEPISEDSSLALQQYVKNGGNLLVLHNGISVQLQECLEKMIGARFITHPAQEEITFVIKDREFTKGCKEFVLVEEPYLFDMEDDDKDVFMHYVYREKEYPAAWQKEYGNGKIIYLMPGHTPEKFRNQEYTKLIQNCINYLLNFKTCES